MFSAIVAYVLTFFIIAPISGFLPTITIIPLGLFIPFPKPLGILASICTAFIAYYLTKTLFDWLNVHFGWYSFLVAFIPMLMNNLRRAAAEPIDSIGLEKAYVIGDIIGCIAVIFIFFIK